MKCNFSKALTHQTWQYFLAPSEWGSMTQSFGTSKAANSILDDPRYNRTKISVHPRVAEIKELKR
jgi:hypothetical protein